MIKEWLKSKGDLKFRFFFWLFALFTFTIPLSSYLSIKLLMLCLIYSLFFPSTMTRVLNNSWEIGFYFIVLIVGLIYTDDVKTGLRVIETSFSMFALSIIFARVSGKIEFLVPRLIESFILGLSISCIICLVNALIGYATSGTIEVFFYYNLTSVLNFQPTYFAYYLIFAISYCLYVLFNSNALNYLLALLVIFFFLMLILSGGQTAFISILFVFSYFILKYIMDKKTPIKSFTILCVLLMFFGIYFMTWINNNGHNNDSWERIILWRSALEAIPNPYFGVGTGDYKTILNDYFLEHDLYDFAKDSFNSHNQLIQLFFSNGILGLIALMMLIARPLYLSFKIQNPLGIILIFPFVIYGLTEVYLGRYQGVVFFALCHQVVIAQYYSTRSNWSFKSS